MFYKNTRKHLSDIQDVAVVDDFNNFDGGLINVQAYVSNFIFAKEIPKGEIVRDIS